VTSRKDDRSRASTTFNGITYDAWVTTAPHGRSSPAFRLWYDKALSYELKGAFVMSYMRSLEGSLQTSCDPEQQISFWEFLDIEFDPQHRAFRFVAYYTVQPSFPNLFKCLVGSPALRRKSRTRCKTKRRTVSTNKTGSRAMSVPLREDLCVWLVRWRVSWFSENLDS
jgi:hypothetical protein